MNLFIPPLRTKVKLLEPWTFELQLESRNISMFTQYAPHWDGFGWAMHAEKQGVDITPIAVTLDEGTVLTIDRIYIRSGVAGFDSVTFRIPKITRSMKKRRKAVQAKRFWAELSDVNRMIVEVIEAG